MEHTEQHSTMSTRPFGFSHLARRPRLPSLETQTVAFVELARAQCKRRMVSMWLRWNGFEVYLRYSPRYIAGNVSIGEVLVIANIEVPKKYQHRGWFWHYLRLCSALTVGGIVVESVHTQYLYDALSKRQEFIEFEEKSFLLKSDRALKMPQGG